PFLPHHTPTTHTYPLSLHDALPISRSASRPPPPPRPRRRAPCRRCSPATPGRRRRTGPRAPPRGSARAGPPASLVPLHGLAHLRSEEHTSELQSRGHLVCRLLLEKK